MSVCDFTPQTLVTFSPSPLNQANKWSYGRLMANIHSSSAKAGILIEESKQPI